MVEHEDERRAGLEHPVDLAQDPAEVVEAMSSQTLEEAGGGTRLTAVIETEFKKRLLRMMAGVVTRHAQQRLESDLAELKRIVEAEG